MRSASIKTHQRDVFPFAAIVGMAKARRALMLLAVDESLRGALIGSRAGTAKSALARSLRSIWPRASNGLIAPFVELPLNVTQDRLIGEIDLERTLASGARALAAGLLAQADGGVVFADDVNLLDANLAATIAAALESGVVRIEREGLSAINQSRFIFIGTYNNAEGDVSSQLRDRVGLMVESDERDSPEDTTEMMARVLKFEKDPRAFVKECAAETEAIRKKVTGARARLAEVHARREAVTRIAQAAMSLGIEGNRADMFAIRAARANAALEGRDEVSEEDLIMAIRLVLLPRATTMPQLEEREPKRDEESTGLREDDERECKEQEFHSKKIERPIEDLIIEATNAPAPNLDLRFAEVNKRAVSPGKRAHAADTGRGRYLRSVARRERAAKIALDATLRAAAPFQIARTRADEAAVIKNKSSFSGKAKPSRNNRVKIKPDDLRFKRFKRRSGVLFIFAVDASGSMAANRMAQAKGAMTKLLAEAYLHRDKVALISFRHLKAEVLLAPTRSVELAQRLFDALPAGGATPLAAGLIKSLELARLARLHGMPQAMLLIFTDGRANVSFRGEGFESAALHAAAIRDELKKIGAALQVEGIASVVIDTKSRFISSGDGRALAELLGGGYVYLPRADDESVYAAVMAAAKDVRDNRIERNE